MKAVRFEQYGDSDVLQTVDVPEPHADAGQVRIAVRAAGVNPIDWRWTGWRPADSVSRSRPRSAASTVSASCPATPC